MALSPTARWALFLNRTRQAIARGEALDAASFHEASYRQFSAWQRSETDGGDYPTEPVGDAVALARATRPIPK